MSIPDPPAAREAAKPKLKISVSRQPSFVDGLNATPGTMALSATTPAPHMNPLPSADSVKKTIKLKAFSKISAPPTPPPPAQTPISAKTKAGRQTRPTAKVVEAKRELDYDDDTDQECGAATKKIKLRQGSIKPGTATVKFKPKGRPINRPLGEGYDSEADDREPDPTIEEQFVLRLPPGEHCEYVRKAIEENRFDPKLPDRRLADISLKFFDEQSRRAVMMVKGQLFAAVMVDLPTVTETMKTWDRKSLMKSADICQMLLVFMPVTSEEEARRVPLPAIVEGGHRWPHGLTPPMHDCIQRRFAKTISRKEIEDKEAEVERLIEEDKQATRTEWSWYDPGDTNQSNGVGELRGEEEEQDAEGELDDAFTPGPGHLAEDGADIDRDMEEALENELQNAFNELDAVAATPGGTQLEGNTPMTLAAETPAAAPVEEEEDESEVSEEDEDDDGDEDEDEGSEEEVSEEHKAYRATMELIAELKKQLASKEAERDRAQAPIMKHRAETQIRSIKQEIENKMRSIGKDEDEELDD